MVIGNPPLFALAAELRKTKDERRKTKRRRYEDEDETLVLRKLAGVKLAICSKIGEAASICFCLASMQFIDNI